MAELIPVPTLDPRTEEQLVENCLLKVEEVSNGLLNDFSLHSPIRSLIEGQAVAGAELLFYVNKLPKALAIKLLEIVGLTVNEGEYATGQIKFTLSTAIASSWTLPNNFLVSNNEHNFYTTESVTIPAGETFGYANIKAENKGQAYNLPKNSVNSFFVPLTYLQSVTNENSITGGDDPDTEYEIVENAIEFIRYRNLVVTKADYENLIKSLTTGRFIVIPLLGYDKISKELGAVHLFVLLKDRSLPDNNYLQNLKESLSNKVALGSQVYVSPVQLVDVNLSIFCKIKDDRNKTDISLDIFNNLNNYLDPLIYNEKENILISELEYQIRRVEGLQYVQAVLINNNANNFILPNKYSLPKLTTVDIKMTDDNDITYDYIYETNF